MKELADGFLEGLSADGLGVGGADALADEDVGEGLEVVEEDDVAGVGFGLGCVVE